MGGAPRYSPCHKVPVKVGKYGCFYEVAREIQCALRKRFLYSRQESLDFSLHFLGEAPMSCTTHTRTRTHTHTAKASLPVRAPAQGPRHAHVGNGVL